MNILASLNYFDLTVIGITLIALIIGYCRGIIISIVNFIRISVGIFLCFYTSSVFSQPLYDNFVKQRCIDVINEKIVTGANVDEIIANINGVFNSFSLLLSKIVSVKSIDFTSDDLTESILTNVFEPVAMFLIKAAVFLAVFIVFFGLTAFLIHIITKRNKRKNEQRGHESALKKTDRAIGMLFGLLKAAVFVFAITSVLAYILSIKPELGEQSKFFISVSQSKVFELLNGINPFNAVTEGLL